MTFWPKEPVNTLITEIYDLADIADLAGLLITDRQRVDIGYIVLQRCKTSKNSLREWSVLPVLQRTYANFKNHFRDAQIALCKTGKIIFDEGLNHTAVVDMVTEGFRTAFTENDTEQLNNADEKEDFRCQGEEMRALIEQMNAVQQQQQQQPV